MTNALAQAYTRATESRDDSDGHVFQQTAKMPNKDVLPVNERQTITALGSTVQYIRGALASLPFLGFLAPEESGSEEQPDPTQYAHQQRSVRQEYSDVYPHSLSVTHPLPSSLTSPVQDRVSLVGSPTVYIPSNGGGASIDWVTESGPISGRGRISFPLSRPIHHERPYASTSYASPGSTVWYTTESPYKIEHPPPMEDEMEPGYIFVHRNLATDEQQVWVYRGERGWVVADMHKDYKHASLRHPTDQLRVLRMRPKTREPGWVLINGYSRLVSRDRGREQGLRVAQN